MRITDIPSPGRFTGSATLRKETVRSLSFIQKACWANPSRKPEIIDSMKSFFDECMGFIAEYERQYLPDPGPEGQPSDPPQTPQEGEDKVEAPQVAESTQDATTEAPTTAETTSEVKLPSILRNKRTKQ